MSTDKKSKSYRAVPILVYALLITMGILVIFSVFLRVFFLDTINGNTQEISIEAPTEEKSLSFWEQLFAKEEPAPEPEPEHMVSEAVISVTGDILMHMPVINSGLVGDGGYDFSPIFRYLTKYAKEADYAAANLETTLCGTDSGYKYSGYPAFNCPEAIIDALKYAGFDMLLTANNHCYDTSEIGFFRTIQAVRSRDLLNLGTKLNENESDYTIRDINGIQVGMLCYTYEAPPDKAQEGVKYMNWNAMSETTAKLINSFLPSATESFFLELNSRYQEMKANGADAAVLFIHWGEEYQLTPNAVQRQIAQQACNIGFDVIVGGHPHVIQPVELLTSQEDSEHKTLCIYSTGNAISNQRIKEMNLKTGHTEDGVLFSFAFSKYSDGTVYLERAELLPCWVNLRVSNTNEYVILPLDPATQDQWQSLYELSDSSLLSANQSFSRTQDLTQGGMEYANRVLTERREQRDADYREAMLLSSNAA